MHNLILALLSGAIGGVIIAALPNIKSLFRNIITLLSSALAVVFSWSLALDIFAGRSIGISGSLGGLKFTLAPDSLGAVFSLIISTLWLFAAVYSMGYMADKQRQNTYYTFFLLSLSIGLGVAYAGNLIAFYLYYELLTFVTYPLVIHERTEEAQKAGKKYIFYNLAGAGLILAAIAITIANAGNVDFSAGAILAGREGTGLNYLLLLFIAGFGVKAAIMPLHRWLPQAMAAPTPVSALLHAVAVVYAGVYGVLRVVYSIFGKELTEKLTVGGWLKWIAAFTIIAGILIATRQDVLKRRLAYQTISHLSYILLGAFTLTTWGLSGAIFQMISYSLLKVSLFFCAGIIAERTGRTQISKMEGVGFAVPVTMAAFSAATLGMIGMMPLATFWSKFYLMEGIVMQGTWPLSLALIISGIINAICFIPVIVSAFKGKAEMPSRKAGKEFTLMVVPTVVLTLLALLFGLFPGAVWPGVEHVVNSFFR
ncbi:MAG: proton-conducting transporter membrane subunit [Oscillospiraceae bacterium]|nr:proton-conducting transporter membrane subunit [Oscillospiraceae bacterium]